VKVALVNADDGIGGASRASYRLYRGLLAEGIDARLFVRAKRSDDEGVRGPVGFWDTGMARLRPLATGPLLALYDRARAGVHSLNLVPTRLHHRIEADRPDLVHLHLLSKETISIREVGRIDRPIVWTLHDMWTFCGTEHYTEDGPSARFRNGYASRFAAGLDLDRWTWRRKLKHWDVDRMTVIAPSRWMATLARESALLRRCRIETIPNGIDTAVFKPIDRRIAREILNLPLDRRLVLFGAMRATSDRRKGFEYLKAALDRIAVGPLRHVVELVVFGATAPRSPERFGLKTHYVGQINDEVALALLYASADAFVAPSRQDNLPNTVMEALACGTPCVAFRVGGLPDMIVDRENGYLAEPFVADDLAAGIIWLLEDEDRALRLSTNARETAVASFRLDQQAAATAALYRSLL
jgi:glycosyltransferase involved in cell wall biosynthesis